MIDKEFAPVELYNTGFTINTDIVSRGSIEARLAGHTVEITVGMVNAVEIGDTNDIVWGTLTPSYFGCIILSYPIGMKLQKFLIGGIDAEVRISVLVFRVVHHFDASVFHKDFHTCLDFLAVLIKILHRTFLLSDLFTHPHSWRREYKIKKEVAHKM